MELISKSHLSAVRSSFLRMNGQAALNEAVSESTRKFSTAGKVSVFLSHKHGDSEPLKDAIALLKSVKVDVYVDWADEGMPKTTSGLTAIRLKEKIKSSDKFILLATEQAIQSKWCNWELGLGDAHKYLGSIVLLVVKEDNAPYSGTEYLDIYPTIVRKDSYSQNAYVVQFPDGRRVDLITWLNA